MQKIFEFVNTYNNREQIVIGEEGKSAITELKNGEIDEYKIIMTKHSNNIYAFNSDFTLAEPIKDFVKNPYFIEKQKDLILSDINDVESVATTCLGTTVEPLQEPLESVVEPVASVDIIYDDDIVDYKELYFKAMAEIDEYKIDYYKLKCKHADTCDSYEKLKSKCDMIEEIKIKGINYFKGD